MNQQKAMDFTIRIEEAAITAVAIYFLTKYNLGLPVWLWVLLFFSPDLSMMGYLANARIGALTYNLFHHRAIAIALLAIGFLMQIQILVTCGLLLLAHASFDRMLGYGLKFTDDFKHTNLGRMGND
ncbi:DUF4260 domain-containing protein [Pedobacter sp. Leaf176]|uniref:DUF4260 domain-containing protein n=1 Tax=Pedobacter sp. Leaf176 TaxID=1736286 RepID=UPI000701EBCD|nr:DUF4260 domain-containing protein [Pedobacter sp. Leaf176]KQR70206.1 hypothetical protein ASF92_09405 [Pedobacter sp. Leaf176]